MGSFRTAAFTEQSIHGQGVTRTQYTHDTAYAGLFIYCTGHSIRRTHHLLYRTQHTQDSSSTGHSIYMRHRIYPRHSISTDSAYIGHRIHTIHRIYLGHSILRIQLIKVTAYTQDTTHPGYSIPRIQHTSIYPGYNSSRIQHTQDTAYPGNSI